MKIIKRLIYVLSYPVVAFTFVTVFIVQLALIFATIPITAVTMIVSYVITGSEFSFPVLTEYLTSEWFSDLIYAGHERVGEWVKK